MNEWALACIKLCMELPEVQAVGVPRGPTAQPVQEAPSGPAAIWLSLDVPRMAAGELGKLRLKPGKGDGAALSFLAH